MQRRRRSGAAQTATDLGIDRPPRQKLASGDKIGVLRAIERLGAIQCTLDEAAYFFGVSQPTLSKQLRERPKLRAAWHRGRAVGKMALRRLLCSRAKRPDASGLKAALFLARQIIWVERDDRLEETASKGDGAIGKAREPAVSLAALSDKEVRTLSAIQKKLRVTP